jgi:hypothetical protein
VPRTGRQPSIATTLPPCAFKYMSMEPFSIITEQMQLHSFYASHRRKPSPLQLFPNYDTYQVKSKRGIGRTWHSRRQCTFTIRQQLSVSRSLHWSKQLFGASDAWEVGESAPKILGLFALLETLI